LPRPISADAPYFPLELLEPALAMKEALSIPRRPKWKYEQTKKEVEANEAGLFKKWLVAADEAVERWRAIAQRGPGEEAAEPDEDAPSSSSSFSIQWPRSTTYFERNLEVYRQLWRTLELSPILLVLIDIRCPPLHFPPSLQEYILSHQQTSRKEVVLVLTKCDLVSPEVRAQWEAWCRREWGKHGWDIVSLEAYRREKRAQGPSSWRLVVLALPPGLTCLPSIHCQAPGLSSSLTYRRARSSAWSRQSSGRTRGSSPHRRPWPRTRRGSPSGRLECARRSIGRSSSRACPSTARRP
jgi:hypothetical protein